MSNRPAVEKTDGRSRPRDVDRTRAEILDAALTVFAEKGLSGARIDEIAALTKTTKPTIYYHFGSKEGLYAAVLEEAYGGIRQMEAELELDLDDPLGAMRRLIEASFYYHARNAMWVRLVSVENIHEARHISGVPNFARRNAPVIHTLRNLLEAGVRKGVFRAGIDALELHLLISSLCFYRVSNRYTWKANFGVDLADTKQTESQCRMTVEAVLRFLGRSTETALAYKTKDRVIEASGPRRTTKTLPAPARTNRSR